MKKVFIAATRQNDGKTITSLGLIRTFQKMVHKVGYIKPVGQRYKEIGGIKVDEDALLVREACGLEQTLSSMQDLRSQCNHISVSRGVRIFRCSIGFHLP